MKIAFTSCIRHKPFPVQKEWDFIYEAEPDYLFLLGDNIYMDYGIWPFTKEYVTAPRKYSVGKFKSVMEAKYRNQFENVPAFKRLVDTMRAKNGFFATWDDHDFAWNNANGLYVDPEKKEIARSLFHQYVNCSTNKPHVYYHIDTPLARVIFIDNRYESDRPGKNRQLISQQQFDFIEDKLHHDFPYTILCGGITLTRSFESWKKYPSQLQKLCRLLEQKERVLFLAGDVHYNTFVAPKYLKKLNCSTPPQLISSGMHINLLGLGIKADNRNNWGLLELEEDDITMIFYNGDKVQQKKSERASQWLKTHLF